MVAVARAIGRKRAMQMLLTGEMVQARTVADWGLINQVVRRRLAEQVAGASFAGSGARPSRPSIRRSIWISRRRTLMRKN